MNSCEMFSRLSSRASALFKVPNEENAPRGCIDAINRAAHVAMIGASGREESINYSQSFA